MGRAARLNPNAQAKAAGDIPEKARTRTRSIGADHSLASYIAMGKVGHMRAIAANGRPLKGWRRG